MGMNSIDPGTGASSWLHITKIKSRNTIARMNGHNTRTNEEELRKSKHIDTNLTSRNEYLIGSKDDDFYRQIVEEVTGKVFVDEEWEEAKKVNPNDLRYLCGDLVKKDAVLCAEVEAKYNGTIKESPQGGWVATDQAQFEEWKKSTLDFIAEKFGRDNIRNAVVHMDEGRPHIHLFITPMYENEKGERRLGFKHFIDGPGDLAQIQTEYAEAIGAERGVKFSEVKMQDRRVIEKSLSQAYNEELPDPVPGQSAEEYRDEVAQPLFRAVNVQRADADLRAARYINTHKEARNKDKVIDRQREELVALRNRVQELEAAVARERLEKDAEKEGAALHPDQELINDVYYPLKESLVEAGMEHMSLIQEMEEDVRDQEATEQEADEQDKKDAGRDR
jgi:hypothetical protein